MAADAADRITIDEAFRILWPVIEPHEARGLLNTAIARDRVPLWADGIKVPADWFEMHLQLGASADTTGRWTAELRMLRAVQNFYETEWTVSRSGVMALRAAAETKSPKPAGGRPRTYDHDEIRAAAFIALARFLKKGAVPGAIPEKYGGSDLADEVEAILGDRSPMPTLLKEVLNPLLNHIKLRLNSGR